MRAVLGAAAEAILWPFGIRRRRRQGPREPGGDDEDGESWELHPWHFVGAITGAAVSWWAFARMKALHATPLAGGSAPGGTTSSTVVGTYPRVALSEFLQLLRGGAVTAVTYLADRPPAGSLLVKTALPTAAMAAASSPLLSAASSLGLSSPPPIPLRASSGRGVVETLLLPGCHRSLFEELRCRDIIFECADVAGEADSDMSRLSLLIDVGGLLATVAALAYLIRNNSQGGGLFTGRRLEDDAAGGGADRRPAVTFGDVAGMEATKEDLREVIAYLRSPGSFYALGARPPRGMLLTGPSGTGKTLLARAVAGEAGVPFFYASSAGFVEVFVGQGAQRIRQFFEQARSCAPCIVFLDELDAVGAARQMSAAGGNQEYAQTLNQLLVELDGVESHSPAGSAEVSSTGGAESSPVVVTIAATNRYDCLDEALVRPGRLDRIVIVGLPNLMERVATLRIHASKLKTENLEFEAIARRTEGSSGADLAHVLNEAALLAARRRAEAVRMEHVEEVMSNPRPQQQQHRPGSSADFPGHPAGVWPPGTAWSPEGGDRDGLAGPIHANAAASLELWEQVLAAMALATSRGHTAPSAGATTQTPIVTGAD